METSVKSSTLNEWAKFLSALNSRETLSPLIAKSENPYRLVTHLEQKFPVTRKYRVGRQLVLFGSQPSR